MMFQLQGGSKNGNVISVYCGVLDLHISMF